MSSPKLSVSIEPDAPSVQLTFDAVGDALATPEEAEEAWVAGLTPRRFKALAKLYMSVGESVPAIEGGAGSDSSDPSSAEPAA